MTDARKFVKDHGGPKAVAEATGRNPNAVSLWVNRNKVPRDAWPEVIKGLGVSLDDLLAIEKASLPANDSRPERKRAA